MSVLETLIKQTRFMEHAIDERDECLKHMSECTRDIINVALHFAVENKLFACDEDIIVLWLWISELNHTGDNHLYDQYNVLKNGKLLEAFKSEYNENTRKYEYKKTDDDLPF